MSDIEPAKNESQDGIINIDISPTQSSTSSSTKPSIIPLLNILKKKNETPEPNNNGGSSSTGNNEYHHINNNNNNNYLNITRSNSTLSSSGLVDNYENYYQQNVIQRSDKHVFVVGRKGSGKSSLSRVLLMLDQSEVYNQPPSPKLLDSSSTSSSNITPRKSSWKFSSSTTDECALTSSGTETYRSLSSSPRQQSETTNSQSVSTSSLNVAQSSSKLSQFINNFRSYSPTTGKKSPSFENIQELESVDSKSIMAFRILQYFAWQLELETLLILYHPDTINKFLFPPPLKKILGWEEFVQDSDNEYLDIVERIANSEPEDVRFEGFYELAKQHQIFKLTVWDQRHEANVNFEEIPTLVQLKQLLSHLNISSNKKFSAKKSYSFRNSSMKLFTVQDFLKVDGLELPFLSNFLQILSYRNTIKEMNINRNSDYRLLLASDKIIGDVISTSKTEHTFIKYKGNTINIVECENLDEMINAMNLFELNGNKKIDMIFFVFSLYEFFVDQSKYRLAMNTMSDWRRLNQDERFKSCPIILIGSKADMALSSSPAITRMPSFGSGVESCQADDDLKSFQKDISKIFLTNENLEPVGASLTLQITSESSMITKTSSHPSIITGTSTLLSASNISRRRSASSPKEMIFVPPKSRKKLLETVTNRFLEDESVSHGRKTQLLEDSCVISFKHDDDIWDKLTKIFGKFITPVTNIRFGFYGVGPSSKSTIFNHMVKIIQRRESNPTGDKVLSPSLMFNYYVKSIASAWKKILELRNVQLKAKNIEPHRSSIITKKKSATLTLRGIDSPRNSTNSTSFKINNQNDENRNIEEDLMDRVSDLDSESKNLYTWCIQVLKADIQSTIRLLNEEIIITLQNHWTNKEMKEIWNENYLKSENSSKLQNLYYLMEYLDQVHKNNFASIYLQSPRKNTIVPKISFPVFLKTYTTVNLLTDVFYLAGQKCTITVSRGSKERFIQQWRMRNKSKYDVVFYTVNISNYDMPPELTISSSENGEDQDDVKSLAQSIIYFHELMSNILLNNPKCVPYLIFTHKDIFLEKVKSGSFLIKQENLSKRSSIDLGITRRSTNQEDFSELTQTKLNKNEMSILNPRLGLKEGSSEHNYALTIISKYLDFSFATPNIRSLIISNTFLLDATNEEESSSFIEQMLDKRVVSDFEIDYELGLGNGLMMGTRIASVLK
ncbi:predicted protein [Naegleria gruberi]|uniref:Predicted protein n=1 Tax=Naegleria gruberi TaxID=5762 RepID=D2V2X8_NAEGR|nr:uncharacterized protein NAEGRDRAFT_63154 [Naegleria gruberi]EFC49139.1 predicted protein [Naegleria gruberi]|eukprot:XP_002681883.1 predicted protein [Naegleria gruberi strain NEG-M]